GFTQVQRNFNLPAFQPPEGQKPSGGVCGGNCTGRKTLRAVQSELSTDYTDYTDYQKDEDEKSQSILAIQPNSSISLQIHLTMVIEFVSARK
ncbi:MAG: hypothetical protein CVU88_08780, partial [Firmicutes bacterium HGW-Firmicutes-13]